MGQGKDEASKSLQPVTLPATTSPAADYMLNSSDVSVLRRVHSTSKSRDWKRGRLHASTMFFLSCKSGAACCNEHTRAARQTEASDNEQAHN